MFTMVHYENGAREQLGGRRSAALALALAGFGALMITLGMIAIFFSRKNDSKAIQVDGT